MSASAPAFAASDVGAVQREYDAAGLGRLTWLGLAVAVIGWALLLGEAMMGDVLAARTGRSTATFHGDMVAIGECLIGSGFGLAILGGLQTGFGALNRFFAAVLTRSSGRGQAPVGPSTGAQPTAEPVASEVDRDAEPLRERRPYHILADGSVEVETIVGTRRFETMHEARDFI